MRMQIPFFGEDAIFNLLPYKTKQDKALKILHGQTNKVIEARRQELKKANITTLKDSNDIGKFSDNEKDKLEGRTAVNCVSSSCYILKRIYFAIGT